MDIPVTFGGIFHHIYHHQEVNDDACENCILIPLSCHTLERVEIAAALSFLSLSLLPVP